MRQTMRNKTDIVEDSFPPTDQAMSFHFHRHHPLNSKAIIIRLSRGFGALPIILLHLVNISDKNASIRDKYLMLFSTGS